MKKRKTGDLILVLIIIVGIGLIAYPSFSNYWNKKYTTGLINSYNNSVSNMDEINRKELIENAREYNSKLALKGFDYLDLKDEEVEEYKKLLDISGTGIMGYIEIPSIDVNLPIYHFTEEKALAVGVGHVEWSSLPVGGESAHSVISGHRGLPSARLFTDLDLLNEGDLFFINILNESFGYEVDQISIVLPEELDSLKLDLGRDYCTLVTCTPYGVNTHRLLVRGHRVDAVNKTTTVVNDAKQIKPSFVAMFIAVPVLIVLFIIAMFKK